MAADDQARLRAPGWFFRIIVQVDQVFPVARVKGMGQAVSGKIFAHERAHRQKFQRVAIPVGKER